MTVISDEANEEVRRWVEEERRGPLPQPGVPSGDIFPWEA